MLGDLDYTASLDDVFKVDKLYLMRDRKPKRKYGPDVPAIVSYVEDVDGYFVVAV